MDEETKKLQKEADELLDNLGSEIKENTFQFDGLYKDCYIRLEADEMSDLLNALNLLYR